MSVRYGLLRIQKKKREEPSVTILIFLKETGNAIPGKKKKNTSGAERSMKDIFYRLNSCCLLKKKK